MEWSVSFSSVQAASIRRWFRYWMGDWPVYLAKEWAM